MDNLPAGLNPVAEGNRTLHVKSVNTAHNESAPVSWTWTVDLTAPSAPSSPACRLRARRTTSATFNFTYESNALLNCLLDGAPVAPCGSGMTKAGLAVGSHTFSVTATDAAGNQGSPPPTPGP